MKPWPGPRPRALVPVTAPGLLAGCDRGLLAWVAGARHRWCRQGQAQLEAGTTATGRVGGLEFAVVGAGQPLCDVQAKAKPTTAGAAGRLVQTFIPLKDPLAVGWRDPRAVVVDGHHRMHPHPPSRQPDRRPRRRVGGGVVEQVAEDAADGQRVDADQQRPSNLDGDRMVRMGEPRRPARLLGECGRVDQRPPRQPGVPASTPPAASS